MTASRDPLQQLWQQHTAAQRPATQWQPTSRHALHQLQQRMRRERRGSIAFLIVCGGLLVYPHPVWRVIVGALMIIFLVLTLYSWQQSRQLFAPAMLRLAPRAALLSTRLRLQRYLLAYRVAAYLLSALPLPLIVLALALDHPALPRQSLLHTWLTMPQAIGLLLGAILMVGAQHFYLRYYLQRYYVPHVRELDAQLMEWQQADAQLN